ncbi:MAG: Nif3-like dinuclear metal center hexameric protein [Chlamydiae bacterium GWF2_49_8]|nr:MAG: Nif3-like dinuclear metal center hexameric protein [Chlamydiae bacterium GWF2_49_8]
MTLQDLFRFLDALFPTEGVLDACHNGLQVEGKGEVRKIALAVSASLAVIEKAVSIGADALIVHHGLFWKNDPLYLSGSKRSKLALLLAHDISLFAYHLPLDAHPSLGNNWRAAIELGWKQLESFGISNGYPIGVKGAFPALPVQEFTRKLVDYYGHKAVLALGGKEEVSSAALLSGGGHRYIEQAVREGVDCFVTGSFDLPVWDIALEDQINFVAMGHHATERVGLLALQSHLQDHLGLPLEFIDLPNPF